MYTKKQKMLIERLKANRGKLWRGALDRGELRIAETLANRGIIRYKYDHSNIVLDEKQR